MLVHRFLEESARLSPDSVALIEPQRTTTYGQLERLANRFAHVYLRAGVRRGDRIIVALENGREQVAAYFGALKAGAAAVPLPPGPRSDRLARAIEDCSPVAAVIDSATANGATDHHPLATIKNRFVLDGGPAVTGGESASLVAALESEDDRAPVARSIDLDLAAIIYTSGSTGEPRGVMLTHRNLVANARSIVRYLALTAHDRVMCVLPFYYVYGLSLLHTHLAVGGTVVIDNRFAFPNVVLQAMRAHRVTGFAGVPSTFALLLHRSTLGRESCPDLRYVTQAGGAMAPARVREWLARGPAAPFYVMYGATEAAARLTYLDPAKLQDKLGSIGRAIPNVEIVVLKEDGSTAAPGEVGELVARGSNVASGYWNKPEESRERFGPEGYRTGDLGYADEDGFLFLVGRRHDMIKIGAHRVGAKEIEEVLQDHPAVYEAAVVAAPDELLGEVAVAFVALHKGSETAAEILRGHCASRLPPHKVPARFVFPDELPKLAGVGKIDKVTLRDSLAHMNAANVRQL
jgi:amino acid adenylation domain-containing protein